MKQGTTQQETMTDHKKLCIDLPAAAAAARVNVTMKDIVIPKMAKDTTVVIKPKEFDLTKFLVRSNICCDIQM